MEKIEIPLGTAPPLAPHGPADMLDLFMTRYDYDYCRDGSGTLQGSSEGGQEGDGSSVSGAVRNRPIFAHSTGEWDGKTTYRVDYVPPHTAADMQKLAAAAYSSGPGDGPTSQANMGTSNGEGGVFTREWFTLPGSKRMDETDISIYKTDYTAAGADRSRLLARPGTCATAGSDGYLYPGALFVPYKADFLTVKGGAKEDDGADIPPKITSEESLKLKKPRNGASNAGERSPPSASAAARYLMSNACPPWVPGAAANASCGPSTSGTEVEDDDDDGSRSNQRAGLGDSPYGQYSCESWLYGDTSLAHPSQLPQGFAGSARADLLKDVFPGSTRNTSNNADGTMVDTATLLRQLAGQCTRANADRKNAPLSLFSGDGPAGAEVDETNPIFLSPVEQRKCASRHKIDDEGFVKCMTIFKSDYVDQSRLPELPGNPAGRALAQETNTNARPTVGEMTTGTLTADMRMAATLRNSHGTLLSNQQISQKMASIPGSGSEKVAAAVAALLPPPAVVDMMRDMARHEAVDKADPHRRKLR